MTDWEQSIIQVASQLCEEKITYVPYFHYNPLSNGRDAFYCHSLSPHRHGFDQCLEWNPLKKGAQASQCVAVARAKGLRWNVLMMGVYASCKMWHQSQEPEGVDDFTAFFNGLPQYGIGIEDCGENRAGSAFAPWFLALQKEWPNLSPFVE